MVMNVPEKETSRLRQWQQWEGHGKEGQGEGKKGRKEIEKREEEGGEEEEEKRKNRNRRRMDCLHTGKGQVHTYEC